MDGSLEDFTEVLSGFEVELEREDMPSLPAAERYRVVARAPAPAGEAAA
jgi:hypothetical protein